MTIIIIMIIYGSLTPSPQATRQNKNSKQHNKQLMTSKLTTYIWVCVSLSLSLYIYLSIYIYIERERETYNNSPHIGCYNFDIHDDNNKL